MLLNFNKYQGTGNDFIIVDNRTQTFPKEDIALIKKLCDRKFGIGADGLMLLENMEAYDFRMVYYNADGNESTMCGNGGRCIAAYAHKIGMVNQSGTFFAIDGEHEFVLTDDTVKLKMIDVLAIQAIEKDYELFTGSPHYVTFRNEIDKIDFVTEARSIRNNDKYKAKGINVNFVETQNGKVSMRTYERGVEDETLSCGTGTVAVALCVANKNELNYGVVDIETPGGNLSVHFKKEENTFTDIWLEGPATFVFEGSINV